MFTGIIETIGKVIDIEKEKDNVHFTLESSVSSELHIDQSIAHNGVCLTVIEQKNNYHKVTAIKETMDKTNLSTIKINDLVNLERCMKLDGRLDGHWVQGHVDCTGIVEKIESQNGSYLLTISYNNADFLTVEKGSITINGISLTVINSKQKQFSVAIIPYTWQHTNLQFLQEKSVVNLEFDILGKYLKKLYENQQ